MKHKQLRTLEKTRDLLKTMLRHCPLFHPDGIVVKWRDLDAAYRALSELAEDRDVREGA